MAYDEYLSERVAQTLKEKRAPFYEKKMFGGICFMVDDKMCVGIVKNELMVRLNPEFEAEYEAKEGCRPMDFTGKRMKGFYYYVNAESIDMQIELEYWIDKSLEFNPFAKASKKKTKK